MESREGGYHAGLDLRTAGRTGLPVRSPVDGWVRRVRTSPRGYGKALYVETAGGHTLVFAHLSRFHAPVQDLLRSAMQRTGRYQQDLTVEPRTLLVRRGELIALSGDSGTGAPHLHLEVRDAAGRPQNPARWLAFPDTVAPRVRAVRLVPVDARAQAAWPTASIVAEVADGLRLAVRGRFAVEVDLRDATGFAPFDVAPLGVHLRVDGQERYALRQDSFDFEHSSDIHLEVERAGDRRWLRLQRRPELRVAGRSGEDAVIEVGDRARAVEIEVFDAAGQRRVVRFGLDPAPGAATAANPEPSALLTVDQALVLVDARGVQEPRLLSRGRPVELLGAGPLHVVDLSALQSGRLQFVDRADTLATLWLAVGGTSFESRVVPGTAVAFADPSGHAAHRGGALVVETVASGDARRSLGDLPGAEPLCDVLRLRRVAWAVRAGIEVSAALPVGAEHAVWMQRSGRSWAALETAVDGAAWRARAIVRDGGDLVLVEDREDPVIGVPPNADRRLAARSTVGPHGLPQPPWPPLVVPVTDRGAGIGDRSPDVLVNGRPYPAVWDPEREALTLDWFVDPRAGSHQVEVRAVDRSGRVSTRSFTVELGAPR